MSHERLLKESYIIKNLDPKDTSKPYPTHRKIRAYFDGGFDVMHSGHYNAFRTAKELCDELIVGIHDADEIKKNKGASPVQTNEERMRLVASCKWVDYVVLSPNYDPNYLEVLEKYNCDFCVHGDDINFTAEGKDPFAEVRKTNKFKALPRLDSISSTEIINRLLRATSKDPTMQKKTAEEEDADSYLLTTHQLCQFMNTARHEPHIPKPEDTVVYVAGSWDLFHSGHVRLLQECKKLGNFLVVGIHEDSTVLTHKGEGFPITNLFERSMNALGCRDVDEIIFDAPFVITQKMINLHRIDIVVEPSIDIDYPHDSSDPFSQLREKQKLTNKLGDLLSKGTRPVKLVKLELKSDDVLTTETLQNRVDKDRKVYEERNKNKA